jgi:hypothetical protein
MPDPEPPEGADSSRPLSVYAASGNVKVQLRIHRPPLPDNTCPHDAPCLPAPAIGVSLCQANISIGHYWELCILAPESNRDARRHISLNSSLISRESGAVVRGRS